MSASSPRSPGGWFAGGALAAVAAVVLFAAGLLVLGVNSERDSDGYVSGDSQQYRTPTYALSSTTVKLDGLGHAHVPAGLVGHVRVRVDSEKPTFVGIARASDLTRYLDDISHQDLDAIEGSLDDVHPGSGPAARPSALHVWAASRNGEGSQTLDWKPKSGDWRLVVMNSDGASDVSARVKIGAELPHLERAGIVGVAAGLAAFGAAFVLIRRGRRLELARAIEQSDRAARPSS